MNKNQIIGALRAFINQRSGIDYRNYNSREALMGDYRLMLRHGKQAREMLSLVEWFGSITAERILEASRSAYSGRLQFVESPKDVAVDYCTGQYFPTEYRAAACAVLASCLWSYFRDNLPPEQRTGDNIRKAARRKFGRGIVATWFN